MTSTNDKNFDSKLDRYLIDYGTYNSKEKNWYFNIRTHQAEYGRISPLQDIIGPYATKEEALEALSTVAKRDKEWEEEDEKWNSSDQDDDTDDDSDNSDDDTNLM